MKTINDAYKVSYVERLQKNCERLDKLQKEYQGKVDKLVVQIDQDRKKLKELK